MFIASKSKMGMFSSKSRTDTGTRVIEPGAADASRELVDPKWLIKAGAVSLVAAAVLAYGAFCLLFYQGQWQVVLHPGPMQSVPTKDLPPHQDIHFAVTEGGQPTLFGWWIPADKDARMESDVLVYFPSGSGAISDHAAAITYWHQQRISVFAFDYRGFGSSAGRHPDEQSLKEDAASVVRYLTETRHIPASHLVFLGDNLGCLPAVYAATQTPGVAAVILEDPTMSQRRVFMADPRTHLLPVNLLLRDDFSLSPMLGRLQPPVLVISSIDTQQDRTDAKQVLDAISSRKSYLEMPSNAMLKPLTEGARSFLDSIFAPETTPTVQGSASAQAPSPEK
jgi:hypothetical protein